MVGEKIDVGRLAFDVEGLPAFDGAVPSPEAVIAVVNGFFAGLDWDEDDDSINEAGETEGETPAQIQTISGLTPDGQNYERSADVVAPSLSVTGEARQTNVPWPIDLSKLDQN